jgi:hypothetical protein
MTMPCASSSSAPASIPPRETPAYARATRGQTVDLGLGMTYERRTTGIGGALAGGRSAAGVIVCQQQ